MQVTAAHSESSQVLPSVIYVMGIDGSGKSTVVNHLATRIKQEGGKVETLWLRFNHVLSKPFLGLCRLGGLTRYEQTPVGRIGYHDFYRHRVIAWLFVWLQYLDALRVRLWRLGSYRMRPGTVIVLDRYVYDVLVDLKAATRIQKLEESIVGSALRKLLPRDTLVLYIRRNKRSLIEARPENAWDKNFAVRLACYERLGRLPGIVTIDNDGDLKDLLTKAEIAAGIGASEN